MKVIPGQMYTYSGKLLDITDPKVEDIVIEDIARGLAFNCHFSGQMPKFFSLAEHSLYVEKKVEEDYEYDYELRLVALLHDASEGYVGDMIKPLKVLLPHFCKWEDGLMTAIFDKYNLPISRIKEIKPADKAVQLMEYEAIRAKSTKAFIYYSPEYAMSRFLEQFYYLLNNFK